MKLGEILPFRQPKHRAIIIPFPVERVLPITRPTEQKVIDMTQWKIDHRREDKKD